MMYMTIQRLHMKLLFEHILVWTIISGYCCSVIFISRNDYECSDCLIKYVIYATSKKMITETSKSTTVAVYGPNY